MKSFHDAHWDYVLHRLLAKFIDLLIIVALGSIWSPLGTMLAIAYALAADGLFRGQSIGKRIVGLQVTLLDRTPPECTLQDSCIRNLPIAATIFIASIPLLKIILIPTVCLFVLAFETYLLITDSKHQRIGDIIAKTTVSAVPPTPKAPPEAP